MSCGVSVRRLALWSICGNVVFGTTLLALRQACADGPHLDAPTAAPVTAHRERSSTSNATASGEGIRQLIARLDAVHFESRDQATRELLTQGAPAVPFLVDALGEESSEVRLRASMLLSQHLTFEDVAPHLVKVLDGPYGPRAHVILRHRAILQVDDACGLQHTAKLLKFWGTDADGFRNRVVIQFADATTREEIERAVAPLWGLHDKTLRFNDALSNLESLSLPYDHPYSPGFVIAQTLARGLGENRKTLIDFAENYLSAFEDLASQLRQQDTPRHAMRKEISDRANMTQGAATYLIQLLDEKSTRSDVLTRQIGIQLDALREDFLQGVASPDSETYGRGVGKVHIVDMLSEALTEPPVLPNHGVVADLIASARQTAMDGNKPKALAFLDVLEAFKELPQHGLDTETGLGHQLAKRLYVAALETPNNRLYHPARMVHDKVVEFIDLGLQPGQGAFPTSLLQAFLRGEQHVTNDECRLALGRYLRIMERLHAANLFWERPEIQPFVLVMRDCVTGNQQLLSAGASYLDSLVAGNRVQGGAVNAEAIGQALSKWTIEATSTTAP
ncbi:MAG: hypothetical protein ACC628_16050 [Pirellulaceae bacterium]